MKNENRIALYCDITDYILERYVYGTREGMDIEDGQGNSSYSDAVQDKFNEISQDIEGIILSICGKEEGYDGIK